MNRLEVFSPDGLPEVTEGHDLASLVIAAHPLADGDIVCVTSKVVSKSEGRVRPGERDTAVDEETVRVVARRGETRIVRNRLGLTMAAAGVDASNVATGSVALLPLAPDASARALRADIHTSIGVWVGIIITDTAGRAWREGQTDIAIGAAGIAVAEDFAGRTDPYGNPLSVTRPAVADELASTAELAQGKLRGRPLSVIRGRADLVLPAGEDGPGAASLIRPESGDLFGYGAREAVVRALSGEAADLPAFGAPAEVGELLTAMQRVDQSDPTAVAAVCFAHGWTAARWDGLLAGPGTNPKTNPGPDVVCRASPPTP